MMNATVEMLGGLGVPAEQIKLESFTRPSPPEKSAAAPDAAPGTGNGFVANGLEEAASITFARAGKSKPVSASQTVLEASEDLGVDISYDCRAGICGQCKTKLLAGRVVMEVEDALDDADRLSNMILSCQARCVDEVVVDA